jgi:elongation factor P
MLQNLWFFEKLKYLCYYEYHRRRLLINKGKNMISVNDFKTGLTLELDNGLWSVVEFLHVKPGKGAAFVRSKLKNVVTGQVVEKTFRAGEKVAKATLDRREMQYLYKEGSSYVMMDNETYDQTHVDEAQIGSGVKYLKENMNVMILTHEGRIIGVDIPAHVELEVVDTPPAEKGNTAQGGTKPATLETGAVVNVPFFVSNGDVIRVDTRTNEYLDRV